MNEAHIYLSNVNEHILILVVKLKAEEPTWTDDSTSDASVLQTK